MTRSTLIIILLVIIIIIVAGAYLLFFVEEKVNTNNVNVLANTNSTVNTKTNTVVNTNTTANTNSITNTSSAVNSNANTNTAANTNIDKSGWKTYENVDYGFTLKHPNNWSVLAGVSVGWLSGTSAQTNYYLKAMDSSLEYSCFIQSFNKASNSLTEWLTQSNLYNNEFGETIVIESQTETQINNEFAILVSEVGPNATRAASSFFETSKATIRFGYFTSMDTEFKDELTTGIKICRAIIETMEIK